jgi:hypothetical protein
MASITKVLFTNNDNRTASEEHTPNIGDVYLIGNMLVMRGDDDYHMILTGSQSGTPIDCDYDRDFVLANLVSKIEIVI